MEPNTFPALRRECSCGCEYITIVLYEPPFVDAEPKCPCCGKGEEKAAPKLVICDHAGNPKCRSSCPHIKGHDHEPEYCDENDTCDHIGAYITVRCIPVTDGKEG